MYMGKIHSLLRTTSQLFSVKRMDKIGATSIEKINLKGDKEGGKLAVPIWGSLGRYGW